jgi:hypothetical protein
MPTPAPSPAHPGAAAGVRNGELGSAGANPGPTPGSVPPLLLGLCDDAAVFPPGSAPLGRALRDHLGRRAEWYAGLAGPLVLPDSALASLAPLLVRSDGDGRPDPLQLSVTLPAGPAGLPAVVAACANLPVRLRSVEVAVPDGQGAGEALGTLAGALGGAAEFDVYVEVPRDERRGAVLDGLAGRWRAKFRTGGVRAELYPDEEELAGALAAAVRAGVAFKATAGLHHALRNRDPHTGFEQHGFVNLLAATAVLAGGGNRSDAVEALTVRDPDVLVARVVALDAAAVERTRRLFRSFGTCSIAEPLAELVALGLLAPPEPAGAT